MTSRDEPPRELFLAGGKVHEALFTPSAMLALRASLEMTQKTHWDSVRSPHLFMGLLEISDEPITRWAIALDADLPKLLRQFLGLFHQESGEKNALVRLHREFFSDNLIRVLREAIGRAQSHGREQVTSLDLLISVLTTSNSVVAECFDRIGIPSHRLTEKAMRTEQGDANEGSFPEISD